MSRSNDVYLSNGKFDFRDSMVTSKTKSSGIDRESAIKKFALHLKICT